MPQPKPLRDMYDLIKEVKKDLKSNLKPLFDYAVRGNKQLVDNLPKINWESLTSKDVLVMISMILSYGLKVNFKIFEDYIKKENMKSSVSLFHFMLEADGMRIRNCLDTSNFTNTFKTIFENDESFTKTLENVHKRVVKIKPKDFTEDQHAQIEALINSLIEGKNIDPELITEEK